jgi:hypothetical protein
MAPISLAAAFWLGLHLIAARPLCVRFAGMFGEGPFRGLFSLTVGIYGKIGGKLPGPRRAFDER